MSNTLELNCLVFGDDSNRIFAAEILCTESVGALKEAIKDKKPTFQHVDTDTLALWKVSFPVNRSLQENLSNHKFVDEESLAPVEAPPTVIHPGPRSSTTLQLFCYVRGDDYHRVFIVKIGMEESVAALKKAIKEKRKVGFDHVCANSLDLWNVNIQENVDKLGLVDEKSLLPWIGLSNVFPQQPADGHLHIVVKELPIASRKHRRSSAAGDDGHEAKRKWAVRQRKWAVYDPIHIDEAKGHYYLEPGIQEESKRCLDAASNREFLLLAGAPGSAGPSRSMQEIASLCNEMQQLRLDIRKPSENPTRCWVCPGSHFHQLTPNHPTMYSERDRTKY